MALFASPYYLEVIIGINNISQDAQGVNVDFFVVQTFFIVSDTPEPTEQESS